MKTSRAAIRYAKALMLEAIENNSLEKMFKDMQTVWKTFEENPDLRHLVESRVIKNSIKSSSLNLNSIIELFPKFALVDLSMDQPIYHQNK